MVDKNPNDIKVQILEDDHKQFDLNFKLIIIGDAGVGKSCLTNQAIKNVFDEAYNATVGFEFVSFNLKLDDVSIKLQIWDTCGQEIYRSLISSFYRNATLAMIVYSIDSRESFSHLDAWLKDVHLLSNPDIKLFLIGNKTDLEDNREVDFKDAKKYADEHGFHYVNETSAKNGFNAKEVFIQAAKILYLEHLKYKNRGNIPGRNFADNVAVKINKEKEPKREKGGCC
jgi:small GTP-binding protein